MNFFQKYLAVFGLLVAGLKYYGGREIRTYERINLNYNDKQSAEREDKLQPSEENNILQETVATLKMKKRNAVNHLQNSFLNYVSSISRQRITGDSPRKYRTIKSRRDIENKRIDSSSSKEIHNNLSPDKLSPLDSNKNNYLERDKNLMDSTSYDTSGSFINADTDTPFNDTDINGTFNDTDTNETTSTTELTTIYTILPVCSVGDDNCTRCQDISPFCHYMYSESRCVYYNYVHASQLYECGERWFIVDKNEALFATALVILTISSSLLGYLIYLRYTVGYEGEVVGVAIDEYAQMRRVMQLMHEKYPHVAKNMESSSSQ